MEFAALVVRHGNLLKDIVAAFSLPEKLEADIDYSAFLLKT